MKVSIVILSIRSSIRVASIAFLVVLTIGCAPSLQKFQVG
jgi:hypothetical protein